MYTRKKGGFFVWDKTHKRRMKEVNDINKNLTNENIHLLELIEEYKKLNRDAWREFDKCDRSYKKCKQSKKRYKKENKALTEKTLWGKVNNTLKSLVDGDESLSSGSDSEY